MLLLLDKDKMDHHRMVKLIDAKYAIEEAKQGLTFWQVLEWECLCGTEDISERLRDMSPWEPAIRWMKYSQGFAVSKYNLMNYGSYDWPELPDQDHLLNPLILADLNKNKKRAPFKDLYWSSPIFRISVVATSYFSFPLFLRLFSNFQRILPDKFDPVVKQITPLIVCAVTCSLCLQCSISCCLDGYS
jgi:hypothetical protein